MTDIPFTIQLSHRLYFVKGTKINTKVLINQMLKLLLKLQGDAVSHSQCPHNTLFLLPFKVNIVKAELKSNNECPPSPCVDNAKCLHLIQLVPKLCIKCIETYCLHLAGQLNHRYSVSQKQTTVKYQNLALASNFPSAKALVALPRWCPPHWPSRTTPYTVCPKAPQAAGAGCTSGFNWR